MQQIAANVYVETAFQGCNVGFVTTGDGVVMVDTPMRPTDSIKWRERIAQAGNVRYLINTEHHIDHILGNYFFPGTVVSHQGTRDVFSASLGPKPQLLDRVRQMDPAASAVVNMDAYEGRLPAVTYTDRMSLYVGSQVFVLMHLPGHTWNETAVYVPNEGVVFPGDNVTTVPPYFRESVPVSWLKSLQALLALDAELVVPGHGEVCGKEAVRELLAFMEEGVAAVRQAIQRGLSAEETAASVSSFGRYPRGKDGQEVPADRQQQGIMRAYEEIKGQS